MQPQIPHPYGLNEGYMWLPTPVEWFADIPEHVFVDGIELERKTSFHVSLFELPHLVAFIAERTGVSPDEVEKKVLAHFLSYVAEKPITFKAFLDDFRCVEKEERKSVVVRCEIHNLNGFFEVLENEFGISVYRQPAHVTIYTLGLNKGIGLHTLEEMESLPKVDLPEVFISIYDIIT
ncbi:alginate lyase family protein [Patescibacteria group bacterium]|nr:alginate lyase family protein [Patescibacteria group bacterium]MBU1500546.1 alginate lyase family protein [Patescibacteria group bacterium]MBU2080435.1 alginate lyase family protein [Patescibacteria group bacterium]MBU2123760.1 alginate lyase family protein [Patescibacteria group bacterium]MBU2194616.1 alginate lyase family protein [Patescibacteria group bacterium]